MEDPTTGNRITEPFAERFHLAKERLVSILLRSQLTDAEYEHLKQCSHCVETVKLLLNAETAGESSNA